MSGVRAAAPLDLVRIALGGDWKALKECIKVGLVLLIHEILSVLIQKPGLWDTLLITPGMNILFLSIKIHRQSIKPLTGSVLKYITIRAMSGSALI